jgi:hypothetical protein
MYNGKQAKLSWQLRAKAKISSLDREVESKKSANV